MFNYSKNKGLTDSEAVRLVQKHGKNVLPETPPPSSFTIFIQQLKSPLVYILIGACVITLLLKDFSDSIIILVAVVINTVLGFFQESKAHKALYALKKLVQSQTQVIRGGIVKKIDSELVVLGDLVILNHGDKVPADGVLVEANRLFLQEAILTGESISVVKNEKDEVYMGTIVASGRGLMRITCTGDKTKIGQIAIKVQDVEQNTPLKIELAKFSKRLAYLVLALTVSVFVLGLLLGRRATEMFEVSVALAVSAIPEGLLVGLTVILAIGMQRILKRKGLIRNLVSAETLGGVTTICLDKTGTLTEGKLQISSILGDKKEIAFQVSIANDLDDPIVISAYEWAVKLDRNNKELINKYKRLDSIPFSSKGRYSASLHKFNSNENVLFINGAPEFLLEWSNLSSNEKVAIKNQITDLTKNGGRLMGLIKKQVESGMTKISEKNIKNGGFEWVGIISFLDPVREDVGTSLNKALKAGIKPLIITGDYLDTALSVSQKIGFSIDIDRTMTGDMLNNLSINELAQKLKGDRSVLLFARTTPDQKSRIVEALKLNGEVVAMMGDGVNDALALKSADIGIVVGNASDTAKEIADLVLLDSRFDTVVSAVEEGRGIFENIRKIIVYLMSSAFNEIIAVTGAILLGFPLPVTAVQILWINLVTDGFPDLALTIDPKRNNLMNEKPRTLGEGLLTSWMKGLTGIISITSGLFALGLFVYVYKTTGNLPLSQTIAFLSLGLNSLIYVFSARTLKEPIWSQNIFANKWLVVAVGIGLIMQLIPIANETTRSFFGTVKVPINYWTLIISVSFITFVMIEIVKFRNRLEVSKNVLLNKVGGD